MGQPVDEQLAVLGQVVGALRALGVAHMVSGSIAASYYVEPRMTRDLDIVVDLTPETAVGLTDLLASDFFADRRFSAWISSVCFAICRRSTVTTSTRGLPDSESWPCWRTSHRDRRDTRHDA